MRHVRLRGATVFRRMAGSLVDGTTVAFVSAVPYAAGLLSWEIWLPPPDRYWPDHLLELLASNPMLFGHPILLWTSVWCLWHFVWLYFRDGRTPGCMLCGIRFVDNHGDPLRWTHGALRVLGHLLTVGTFGLGWAWMFVSPSRKTWPDIFSRTWLIEG